MKGVILGICPAAQLVDVSHRITPFLVSEAAYVLGQAWSDYPPGTVHLAVVDPGVGSSRRALVASADGHYFVAPDNGILSLALSAARHVSVREITASTYFRQPLSRTFHGRDIFAPVAAWIASGVPAFRFGKQIEDYVRPTFDKPVRTSPRSWSGTILKIDRFGNVVTNFPAADFPLQDGAFQLRIGPRDVNRFAYTYSTAPAGEPFVMAGSAGYLEVSIAQADAAAFLGVHAGAPLDLRL